MFLGRLYLHKSFPQGNTPENGHNRKNFPLNNSRTIFFFFFSSLALSTNLNIKYLTNYYKSFLANVRLSCEYIFIFFHSFIQSEICCLLHAKNHADSVEYENVNHYLYVQRLCSLVRKYHIYINNYAKQ